MDIENIWKNQSGESFEIEENQIHTRKSKNLVAKIVSRLKLEQRATIFLGPLLLYFPLHEAHYTVAAIAVVYMVLLYFYYRYILHKVGEVTYKDSVVEFLNNSLNALKWFKVHYLSLGIFSFGIGFFMTSDSIISEFERYRSQAPWILSMLLVTTILGCYLGYYLNYHRHFKRMKQIVEELTQNS